MKEEDKEEYLGEFKDNIIKIIVLFPAIFCGILYFFYDDNDVYLWLFLGLLFLDLIIIQFILKKKNK